MALKSNNKQFLSLAPRLGSPRYRKPPRLEARNKAIADLVKPIEDGLKNSEERLTAVGKERVGAYADLRGQVEEIGKAGAARGGDPEPRQRPLHAAGLGRTRDGGDAVTGIEIMLESDALLPSVHRASAAP